MVTAISGLFIWGCSKSSNSDPYPELIDKATGTYNGSYSMYKGNGNDTKYQAVAVITQSQYAGYVEIIIMKRLNSVVTKLVNIYVL